MANNKYLKSLFLPLLMVLALVLSFSEASGQTSGTRPKLGLVLSGGGSHGIAHVGVLKVMEEAGLRPDIITGTSMGSIIGGFYSIGYSPDSLVKILKAMDWDLLLSNKIPQNKIFFTEKKYFDNSIMSLPLLSRKVRLPSGLISGQQIENSLSYYAWPAATINDFRKLPVPFACVGADLITVREVEFTKGYLPDALRASSAIPTVFAPIKIDTALLSDGGLINNFPAREAKDMGADIIIGSYTGFHPKSEDELNSIPGIIQQIGFSRSMEEFERQKKLVNILISPLVKPYQILDFKQVDSIVAIGYKAALPFKEKFRRLADSLNMLGKQEKPRYILDNKFFSFDRIRIEGNSIIPDGQVLGILDIAAGQQVSKQLLYDRIELLYGMNWFEKVKYRIDPRPDSLILVLECSEKPNMMLYGSGHYDNSLGSGIIVSVFIKNIFTQGSEFKVDSYIGQYYRVAMSVSQYLGRNQKFGITAHLLTDNTLLPVLTLRGESGAWKSTNLLTGMNINRILGLNHMLSLSFDFENRFLIPRYISRTGIKSFDYNLISAAFNYQVNSLDNRHFPEHGSLASVYGGFSDFFSGHIKKGSIVSEYNKSKPGEFSFGSFYTLKADWEQHFRLSSHTAMSLRSNLLYLSDCDSISSQDNFFLAGGTSALNSRSVAMYGFHPCEIPVKQLATFGMGLDWRIGKDLHVEINGNFGAIREADRVSGYSLLAGYGAGLGYMSIIGPLRVGLMHGIYGREKYFSKIKGYISMGFSF